MSEIKPLLKRDSMYSSLAVVEAEEDQICHQQEPDISEIGKMLTTKLASMRFTIHQQNKLISFLMHRNKTMEDMLQVEQERCHDIVSNLLAEEFQVERNNQAFVQQINRLQACIRQLKQDLSNERGRNERLQSELSIQVDQFNHYRTNHASVISSFQRQLREKNAILDGYHLHETNEEFMKRMRSVLSEELQLKHQIKTSVEDLKNNVSIMLANDTLQNELDTLSCLVRRLSVKDDGFMNKIRDFIIWNKNLASIVVHKLNNAREAGFKTILNQELYQKLLEEELNNELRTLGLELKTRNKAYVQ